MLYRPAVDYLKFSRAGDCQCPGGDFFCYSRACGDKPVLADFYAVRGRDEIHVAADKRPVPDIAAGFFYAVVVYGYSAAAEIYVPADVGIADISQMPRLCVFADDRVFYFDEVAQMDAAFN